MASRTSPSALRFCSVPPTTQLDTRRTSGIAFFGLHHWDLKAREPPAWFPFATYRRVHSFTPRSLVQPPFFRSRYPQTMLSTFFSTTPVFFLLAATLLFTAVGAIPLPADLEVAERGLEARAVSLLSSTDISGFTSFTQFARAAYCPQSKVKNWSCGGRLSLFPGCDGECCSYFRIRRSLQRCSRIPTDFDRWERR